MQFTNMKKMCVQSLRGSISMTLTDTTRPDRIIIIIKYDNLQSAVTLIKKITRALLQWKLSQPTKAVRIKQRVADGISVQIVMHKADETAIANYVQQVG